jgi:N-acetylglucosamine kinase-like BadF-type ATPase
MVPAGLRNPPFPGGPWVLIGDSGATHTRFCVADARGVIRSYGLGGPGNAFAVGWPKALANLRDALSGALQRSGLAAASVAAAVLGSASVDQHGEGSARIKSAVGRLLPRSPVKVLGDMHIALQGALGGRPGVVIVSGTGSVIFAKGRGARQVKIGGWGALFGDEGSAQWIAREALRRAAHAVDGTGPATRLSGAFLRHFQVPSFHNIVPIIYKDPTPAGLGALAPLVVRLASEGDRAARAVMCEAGEGLAEQAAAAIRRLRLCQPQVSYQGSLFRAGGIVLNPLRKALKALCPDARLVAPLLSPLGGAWLLALQVAGITARRDSIAAFGRNYHATFEGRLGKN